LSLWVQNEIKFERVRILESRPPKGLKPEAVIYCFVNRRIWAEIQCSPTIYYRQEAR